MRRFAEDTSVSVDSTRGQIEKILINYGADQFVTGRDDEKAQAMIMFRCRRWQIRFILPLPKRGQFLKSPTGKPRSDNQVLSAWEQAQRSRWRALYLVIKAKLEAIASGITTFEDEFLSHIILPDNQQVRDWIAPQLKLTYESGKMPQLLPGLPAPKDGA